MIACGKLYRLLFMGVLCGAAVACQPASREESQTPTASSPNVTATATLELEVDTPPLEQITRAPTPTQPNRPTPLPTATAFLDKPTPQNWQTFVDSESGILLGAPIDWVDVGSLANIKVLADVFGQDDALFIADSLDTGIQVLTGRELEKGGFAFVTRASNPLPANLDITTEIPPGIMLKEIMDREELTAEVLPIEASLLPGVFAELERDFTGLIMNENQSISVRLALYYDQGEEETAPIYMIMGAATAEKEVYWPLFDSMISTLNLERAATITNDGIRFLDTSGPSGGRDAVIGQTQIEGPDFWAFEAEAGQFATITLAPENESDLIMTLVSPSGRNLLEQDSGYGGDTEVIADLQLNESGVYLIQVNEFFSESDRYTLSITLSEEPIYRGGGIIRFNQELQGQLQSGAQDIWRFSGQAGQSISIVLDPAGEFDALFTLYGPDGREIATFDEGYSGDTEILGGYELPFTGEYTIIVSSFAENGGSYSLALDEGNENLTNFYEAGDLIYGDAQRELIRPGEAHIWFLTGRAGDELMITVTPITENLDLDVWLLDPESRRLVMQDAALSGDPEIINFSLPRDGEYIVVVQEFFGESGEYEIEPQVSGDNYLISYGPISYDQTLQGSLPTGRGTIWQFDATAGEIVDIRVSPVNPESDFIISIRDPAGQPILQTDNTVAGIDEIIDDFEISTTGVWTIVVQEYFDAGGAYQLTLQQEGGE